MSIPLNSFAHYPLLFLACPREAVRTSLRCADESFPNQRIALELSLVHDTKASWEMEIETNKAILASSRWLGQAVGGLYVYLVSCGMDASGGGSYSGAVASTDAPHANLPNNREVSFKIKRWQVDSEGQSPVLHARVNVDWLTLDPNMFAHFFPRLYDCMTFTITSRVMKVLVIAPAEVLEITIVLPYCDPACVQVQGSLSSPPPQPSILRSIQHVCKCKERYHPPHPNPASCVASNICASARNVIISPTPTQHLA